MWRVSKSVGGDNSLSPPVMVSAVPRGPVLPVIIIWRWKVATPSG